MPVSCAMLLSLLDEVGRRRALWDHETDILEAIIQAENAAGPSALAA